MRPIGKPTGRNRRIDVIVMDFDGTIVESVRIKDAAFEALFRSHTRHFDEIMRYHLSHNATIRFEKFEHIYRRILQREYTDRIREDLSRRFSDLVCEKIAGCPYVPGALGFLNRFHGKVPLYLVSVSPEDELRRILSRRELTAFFRKVYSASWRKAEAISDILYREKAAPDSAVFVGDTEEDLLAAEERGVLFVGRRSGKAFGDDPGAFDDLNGVGQHIEGLRSLYSSESSFERKKAP